MRAAHQQGALLELDLKSLSTAAGMALVTKEPDEAGAWLRRTTQAERSPSITRLHPEAGQAFLPPARGFGALELMLAKSSLASHRDPELWPVSPEMVQDRGECSRLLQLAKSA